MELFYSHRQLNFNHPFTLSNGNTKTTQDILVVALSMGRWVGYGEVASTETYQVTIQDLVSTIEKFKKQIEKFAFTDAARYWHYLHHLLPNSPFLVSALDMAANDLLAKMRNLPLHSLHGLNSHTPPTTCYTIGMDSLETMTEKIKSKPWPLYKIKVGKDALAILTALRKETQSPFIIDVNGGWSITEAEEILPLLQSLNILLVEQPLPPSDWEGMAKLHTDSPIPIFADESCMTEKDIPHCASHFHGINIKFAKCSGITPAIRMIDTARSKGLKIMLGNMNESAICAAALVNIAHMADFLDADGPLLHQEVTANGLKYENGSISLSGRPGLGITPSFDWTN